MKRPRKSGKKSPDLLTNIEFDITDLDKAAEAADQLSAVLALTNGEGGEDVDAREVRDKAYSFMKLAFDEFRNTSQYVFWSDEDRQKGYVSAYKKRFRKSKPEVTEI